MARTEVEFDFQRYVALRRGLAEKRARDGAAYSYRGEHRIRRTLTVARPVAIAIEATVRLWQSKARGELFASGVKATTSEQPRAHQLVARAARTLGIPAPPLYVAAAKDGLEAHALGTDEEAYLVLPPNALEAFTDDELLFVLGHAIGHIHNGQVVLTTALYYLAHDAAFYVRWVVQPAILALRGWLRRAELTCDRAGLLCSPSLDVAAAVLDKQGVRGGRRDKRLAALRLFADSAFYRAHIEAGPGGLSATELDDEVAKIVSVL
jgi:Zn-dependent protease with chaperone function